MHRTDDERRGRRLLCLLLVAGLILSGLALTACGSSSSSSSSTGTGSTTEESEPAGGEKGTEGEEEASGGDSQETTVYVEGVPNLKELYESSNEEPPTSGPPAAKGKTVAFFTCSMQLVGCAAPAEAFVEAGKALGWNVRIFDGKLNVGNAYAPTMRSAIASKPDAIVVYGIGCEEVQAPAEEAKAAGIPLVEAITEDCSEKGGPELFEVENKFNKNAQSAGEFYEKFGENQGAYVVDKTEGKAKVITTEWLGGTGPAVGAGYKKVFEKCAECEILENIEWEAAEQAPGGPLEQRFKTALTKYPEANAAIISYDSMAAYGGLAKAVVDSGRAGDLLSVAGEGFAETVSLMEEEKGVNAEAGAWDNKWAGWELADQLNRHFNGQPSVPQGLGLGVINLENNLPPKGQNYEADVDYVKAYEEIWNGK